MRLFIFILLFVPITAFHAQNNIYPDIKSSDPIYVSDALNRLYIVGLQALKCGDLTKAEISFRSILAFPYRSQDWRTTRYYKGKAHFYLADVYFIQKKYIEASSHYTQVVKEYGEVEEYSSALFKLGRSLILSKKEKEGIQMIQDYIYNYATQEGSTDNSLYWIAQGYISLENYSAALKTLHQILRDFPNSPIAYDVRLLVSKMDTDLNSGIPASDKKILQDQVDNNMNKMLALEKEKELVVRIKQLLELKEKLLLVKERKLELLDKISKSRVKALENQELTEALNSGV